MEKKQFSLNGKFNTDDLRLPLEMTMSRTSRSSLVSVPMHFFIVNRGELTMKKSYDTLYDITKLT